MQGHPRKYKKPNVNKIVKCAKTCTQCLPKILLILSVNEPQYVLSTSNLNLLKSLVGCVIAMLLKALLESAHDHGI